MTKSLDGSAVCVLLKTSRNLRFQHSCHCGACRYEPTYLGQEGMIVLETLCLYRQRTMRLNLQLMNMQLFELLQEKNKQNRNSSVENIRTI